MILKFTRNKKKEQNVFAIFTVDCCIYNFEIACCANETCRTMDETFNLDRFIPNLYADKVFKYKKKNLYEF